MIGVSLSGAQKYKKKEKENRDTAIDLKRRQSHKTHQPQLLMLQAAFQATSQARKQPRMRAKIQSIRLGACGPRASLSLLDHFPLRRERAVRRTPSLFPGHAMPCLSFRIVVVSLLVSFVYTDTYNTIQYTLYTLYSIALSRSYFSFYSLLLVYRLAFIIIHGIVRCVLTPRTLSISIFFSFFVYLLLPATFYFF